jgi:hypothetical protein
MPSTKTTGFEAVEVTFPKSVANPSVGLSMLDGRKLVSCWLSSFPELINWFRTEESEPVLKVTLGPWRKVGVISRVEGVGDFRDLQRW